MALTDREAFKVGFLSRCIEDQIPPEEIPGRVKQALDLLEKRAFLGSVVNQVADVGKGLGSAALGWGIPLAALAPPVLGGIAGYGLARGTDIDDVDIKEIKDREVLDEYRRQTEELKRRRAARDYARTRQHTGRVFM